MDTKTDALIALRDKIHAGDFPKKWSDLDNAGLAQGSFGLNAGGFAWDAVCNGSLDAARALHKAVLPGWGWRVCECYLSDDAAVFPDFNCPEHGERLKREYSQEIDWFGITDIDLRPAGNPARAWFLAIIEAMIAMRRMDAGGNILDEEGQMWAEMDRHILGEGSTPKKQEDAMQQDVQRIKDKLCADDPDSTVETDR